MFRIEQNGRMSLGRPKPPTKGGSAPDEEDEYTRNMPKYKQTTQMPCIFFTCLVITLISHSALPILLPSNCQVTHTTSLILRVVVMPQELIILQPVQKTEEQYNTITKIFKISLRAVLRNFIP